jgi:hypothetical protein
MGFLRDRMVEEMKLRNFSPARRNPRLRVSRLARYPQITGSTQQGGHRAFLVYLTVERKLSPGLTGHCSGLRFCTMRRWVE